MCASRTRRSSRRRCSPTATSPAGNSPTRRSTSSTKPRRGLRIEIDSMPFEIDVVERRIRQLEIERAALAKETDEASKQRLERSRPSSQSLQEERDGMVAHWQLEKDAIADDPGRQGAARAGAPRRRARRARRRPRARRAAALRPHPGGRARGRRDDAAARDLQRDGAMLKEEVDEEDVAEIVAKWTGIPVSRLMEGEMAKLVRLEERAARACRSARTPRSSAVANAIRRSRAGLSDPHRPDRVVPVPRPDRCRQDRARAHARRLPVRRRAGDGAHRHVGVHGEALGVAARRRAARLRRLRRGRPAHRGGPPPPVRGDPARRDREGAPRRVQRPVAAHGRRSPHRRSGSHGRLHEHGRDHDQQPRRRWRRGRR